MVNATRAPVGTRSVEWQESAACATAEPDLFFPISAAGRSQAETSRARAVCHRCAVREDCLDYAMATGQQYGIWGGLTEDERQRLQTTAARLTIPG
jgi:WhiB family redox-sensing transcriptional regulator